LFPIEIPSLPGERYPGVNPGDTQVDDPDVKVFPFTSKVAFELDLLIPIRPLLEINILIDPLVSSANDWLSFVPKIACAPKLLPPCTKAFVVVGFIKEAVEANEALTAYEALIGTNESKLTSNVLLFPLVNVKFGLEKDAVVNNEPVSIDPPPPLFKAYDAVKAYEAEIEVSTITFLRYVTPVLFLS
jgi:hypothetical protein